MRLAVHVARWEKEERFVQCFGGGAGHHERERQLGKSRRRWEYDIKIDLKKSNVGEDWIRLAQDTVGCRSPVNSDMNLPAQ